MQWNYCSPKKEFQEKYLTKDIVPDIYSTNTEQIKPFTTNEYLNHNLIEAFLFGAPAQVKVGGEWDDDWMLQVKKPVTIKAGI